MAPSAESQQSLDQRNSDFWNELCGTNKAKTLGVTDRSAQSLRKFDEWFFDYYFYLDDYIPFDALRNERVLEVGLGYGSVLQRAAESGAIYSGLDIAAGPVEMGNYRLATLNLEETCVQGSVLEAPFDDGCFDRVITLGCLHHTGDIEKALAETYRLLKPGGKLLLMIYYAYSLRRWSTWPGLCIAQLWAELSRSGETVAVSTRERAAYDYDSHGAEAPETVFTSKRGLRRMTGAFSDIRMRLELLGEGWATRRLGRRAVLRWIAPIGGRHIYATLVK